MHSNGPIPARAPLRAKPEEAGSGNPDPTMKPAGKADPATIKGENMPPRGGEDIAPADGRSPERTQEHAGRGVGQAAASED